jgi:hypothetical protein
MAEQMAFEGMDIEQERIKLKAAWVAGLGMLHIGDKVRIEGTAKCVGVAFEKDPKTGEGIRIHIIAVEEITATEVVTDDTIAGLGN